MERFEERPIRCPAPGGSPGTNEAQQQTGQEPAQTQVGGRADEWWRDEVRRNPLLKELESLPPGEALSRVVSDAQDKAVETLISRWPRSVLQGTPWESLAEFLVSELRLVPAPPSDIAEPLFDQLQERFHEKVKDVVRAWRQQGLL